jgi:hypothetical protein
MQLPVLRAEAPRRAILISPLFASASSRIDAHLPSPSLKISYEHSTNEQNSFPLYPKTGSFPFSCAFPRRP